MEPDELANPHTSDKVATLRLPELRTVSISLPQTSLSDRARSVTRGTLFVYLGLVLCPIRYWALGADVDSTWIFGLNYAAANHLVMGRDIVWTSGPLAYLVLPIDIGGNLAKGLVFQSVLWGVLLTILWDLFFRSGYPLRNLTLFSVFLGLSGPLYHSPPNPLGAGDLLLVGTLLLLVQFQLRGGRARYLVALVMIGLIPLIQFVGLMIVLGLVMGLIVDQVLHYQKGVWRELVLAVAVPTAVAMAGYRLALGSMNTLAAYAKSSLELSSGYNLAMATWGRPIELLAGFEALVLLAIGLVLLAARNCRTALFLIPLLAAPLLVNIKHSYVRQDTHITYLFGFVAVSLALVTLVSSLHQRAAMSLTAIALVFATLCQDYVGRFGLRDTIQAITGLRAPSLIWHALRFGNLRRILSAEAQSNFPNYLRIEPEIRDIIQNRPVASLSMSYTNAYMEGLTLVLYPVIQRYSAYTPHLDELNANWVRDHGPRFLIFDGKSIDGRHPWTETPAMWAEIYRWYDTRLLGAHNLLLERRSLPRFARFEPVTSSRLRFGAELQMPASEPVFWSMKCSLTGTGKLRAVLFRVPEVTMTVDKKDGRSDVFRVLLAVIGSPSPGNYLPGNLAEFASVFGKEELHSYSVEKLRLGGPGTSAYAPSCAVEFLRLVR
jgi:hypothetical protein